MGSTSASPKILLAKPGLVGGATPVGGKLVREDESTSSTSTTTTTTIRSRVAAVGSLNLFSDNLDFHLDRFLPFLTDNTDFMVVGVIGPTGVGKSTLLNHLYGFDPTSPGMLPPFTTQSDETRSNARHCTVGIEPRVSSERILLLDTLPVFSPSVLAELTRPDGSSTIPLLSSETLSSELAYQLITIQLAVLLASVCHILLVVSEGSHDTTMWRLLSTVDLLKHNIPDPSMVSSHSQSSNMDNKDKFQEGVEEYMATPVFIHTKLPDEDVSPQNAEQVRKALTQYFHSSSFTRQMEKNASEHVSSVKSYNTRGNGIGSNTLESFLVPRKRKGNLPEVRYESYETVLWKIRGHVLSMTRPSFTRSVSEREWLKNTAKIWELVRNSPIIAEYGRTLQNSALFRK